MSRKGIAPSRISLGGEDRASKSVEGGDAFRGPSVIRRVISFLNVFAIVSGSRACSSEAPERLALVEMRGKRRCLKRV